MPAWSVSVSLSAFGSGALKCGSTSCWGGCGLCPPEAHSTGGTGSRGAGLTAGNLAGMKRAGVWGLGVRWGG